MPGPHLQPLLALVLEPGHPPEPRLIGQVAHSKGLEHDAAHAPPSQVAVRGARVRAGDDGHADHIGIQLEGWRYGEGTVEMGEKSEQER